MRISIIIPALNEAACIEQSLLQLQQQTPPFEVIVVDGGSSDDTPQLATKYARVISSKRGRANQMNAGAAIATGDILLFLHADSQLPPNALDLIQQSAKNKIEAGNFRLAFDLSSPLLNFYSFFTRFKFPRFSFGDRGLFVRRDTFAQIGGFASIPIFEDLELACRLYHRGSFTFLKAYVTTAARRFEQHGHLKQQLLNAYLWIRYISGTSPEKLARLYKYNTAPIPEHC